MATFAGVGLCMRVFFFKWRGFVHTCSWGRKTHHRECPHWRLSTINIYLIIYHIIMAEKLLNIASNLRIVLFWPSLCRLCSALHEKYRARTGLRALVTDLICKYDQVMINDEVSYCKTEVSLPSSQALSWSNKLFFLFQEHPICTDFLAFPLANDSAENF